jgi:hypothetical protein
MPGKEHSLVTESAIKLLNEREQQLIAPEADNLINEYCKYPDTYFDLNGGEHEKVLPYYFETDEIQFHYIPDTPIVDKYRYWNVADGNFIPGEKAENLNWQHACNGFTYYLAEAVQCLKHDNRKAAFSFTGWLLHMLQDACFALHSMEGPYGTDIFILDRLFDYGDNIAMLPSNILAETIPTESVTMPDYRPVLLGKSVDEAVFHLYRRYVNSCLEARKLSFKIVQAKYSGKALAGYYEKMFHNIVCLSADVIHTICSIADDKFEHSEHLAKVFLSDFEPIDRPWGLPGPYRFITLLNDKAININEEIVPLKLIIDGEERTFKKGMSFGSHSQFSFIYEIPPGVYSSFACFIGLQAEYIESGVMRIEIINNGKIVFDEKFDSCNPAQKLTVLKPGGRFEIRCSSPNKARSKTVLTLGQPELIQQNPTVQ